MKERWRHDAAGPFPRPRSPRDLSSAAAKPPAQLVDLAKTYLVRVVDAEPAWREPGGIAGHP